MRLWTERETGRGLRGAREASQARATRERRCPDRLDAIGDGNPSQVPAIGKCSPPIFVPTLHRIR